MLGMNRSFQRYWVDPLFTSAHWNPYFQGFYPQFGYTENESLNNPTEANNINSELWNNEVHNYPNTTFVDDEGENQVNNVQKPVKSIEEFCSVCGGRFPVEKRYSRNSSAHSSRRTPSSSRSRKPRNGRLEDRDQNIHAGISSSPSEPLKFTYAQLEKTSSSISVNTLQGKINNFKKKDESSKQE